MHRARARAATSPRGPSTRSRCVTPPVLASLLLSAKFTLTHPALQDALGHQTLSTKPTAPATRFGSSKRSELASSNAAPGPGTYRLKTTLGAACTGARTRWPSSHSPLELRICRRERHWEVRDCTQGALWQRRAGRPGQDLHLPGAR